MGIGGKRKRAKMSSKFLACANGKAIEAFTDVLDEKGLERKISFIFDMCLRYTCEIA